MQVLPNILITALPFFLSLSEWCCQVQYVSHYKSLDLSLSEQKTCVGNKTACSFLLTKSWTLKTHFVQQPETATAAFILCCNPPNFDSTHTTLSCNIWWSLSWKIDLFPHILSNSFSSLISTTLYGSYWSYFEYVICL